MPSSSGGGQPVAMISIFSRTILRICQLFTSFYIANGFLLSCLVPFLKGEDGTFSSARDDL